MQALAIHAEPGATDAEAELWRALAEDGARPGAGDAVGIVLADDHPLFRAGLARAIATHRGLALLAEAADGADALALVQELEPELALLDVRMPGLDGIEVCAAITSRGPTRTRVVILTGFDDPAVVQRARKAGAAGFVSKDASRSDVCDALLEVARGGSWFPRGPRRGW